MHAKSILSRLFNDCATHLHKARRQALTVNVLAALRGQSLTVTHLGRAIQSDAQEKHCIKRADRLLSNRHLHGERREIYGRITRLLVGARTRPVIVVDWSDMDGCKRHFLLRASLPLNGRSQTLYEEVHTLASKEKPKTHRAFLHTFHDMLPAQCRPIMVTDAGFRTPWFKQVEAFGWDWIGRVRNRDWAQLHGHWVACKSLYRLATQTPRALGEARLTRTHAKACRLVLYKGKPKGRVHLNRFGQPTRSTHSLRHARAHREPWLLATSLPEGSNLATQAVRSYRLRMQIEEAFRDLKSTRFGLSLELHRTYQEQRLQVLLLIGALALWVAWLVGKALELTGQHRQYQANTVTNRTVLSTIFIGLRVIEDHRATLRAPDIVAARRRLREEIAAHCVQAE